MKPQGKEYDGSSSLFEIHQDLHPYAVNSIWLTQFQPKKQEHLNFVRLLLCTLCKLDICCAISGTYPAYVAGMFSSYFAVTLCVVKHNSVINPLSEMAHNFMIGPFQFQLHENQVNAPDYKCITLLMRILQFFSKLFLSIRQLNVDHDAVSIS